MGKDIKIKKRPTKDEIVKGKIANALTSAAKNHIVATIDDLKLFQSAFDNIDERHKYEKVIYEPYIKNNAFVLTDEQRNEAYKLYKENKKN